MRRLISGCLLALALVASSHAQTPLFLDVQPSLPGGSPPPTVNAYYDVEIDFDALRHAPEELEIALPDGEMFIAKQTQFLYRAGYLSREEWDPPGTPPIYPHPGLPNDQFSYRWVGGNSQYDVALTVIEGRLTGPIYRNQALWHPAPRLGRVPHGGCSSGRLCRLCGRGRAEKRTA